MIIYGVIYQITDLSGKCYIGQHVGDGSDIGITYFGSGKYIKRAIKKHGIDNFSYTILEKCYSKYELDEKEKYYIKHSNSLVPKGYNFTLGGTGGLTRENFSEQQNLDYLHKLREGSTKPEVKYRRSVASKKRWSDPKYVLKQSESHKGYKATDESKRKNSETHKIIQNKPEIKTRQKEISIYILHIRWHVNRNTINPNCAYCINRA